MLFSSFSQAALAAFFPSISVSCPFFPSEAVFYLIMCEICIISFKSKVPTNNMVYELPISCDCLKRKYFVYLYPKLHHYKK